MFCIEVQYFVTFSIFGPDSSLKTWRRWRSRQNRAGGGEVEDLVQVAPFGVVSGEGIKRWGIRIGTSDRFGRGRGELPIPFGGSLL